MTTALSEKGQISLPEPVREQLHLVPGEDFEIFVEDSDTITLLRVWLQDLCQRMRGRVLSFNTSTANVWGQLKAQWDRDGIAIASLDSQIAATASRHGLVLGDTKRGGLSESGTQAAESIQVFSA